MSIEHFNFFNNRLAETSFGINAPYPLPVKLQLASYLTRDAREVNLILSKIYEGTIAKIEKDAGFLLKDSLSKWDWISLQFDIFTLLKQNCLKVGEIFIRTYSQVVLRDISEQLCEDYRDIKNCNGIPLELENAISSYRPEFMDCIKVKASEMTENWESKITDKLIRNGIPVIPVKQEPMQIEGHLSSF